MHLELALQIICITYLVWYTEVDGGAVIAKSYLAQTEQCLDAWCARKTSWCRRGILRQRLCT